MHPSRLGTLEFLHQLKVQAKHNANVRSNVPIPITREQQAIVRCLTTLHDYRMPYDGNTTGEIFIHWYYKTRNVDTLSYCEIFHLNMLQYFNVMDRVDVIHVRCATNSVMTQAMRKAIEILSCGKAKVDFKIVEPKKNWEHDTFKECVEYGLETGKFIYYIHFKGASRIGDTRLGFRPRPCRGSTDLDIYYWCFLMYKGLFSAPNNAKTIGPLPYAGMNKSYRVRNVSWSLLKTEPSPYFYCGSFQAFLGSYIKECLHDCGLDSRESRKSILWVGDPYTVEMFLSLVSYKKDAYSLPISFSETHDIYHVYSKRHIILFRDEFDNLFKDCDMSQWERNYNEFLAEELKKLPNYEKVYDTGI